MPFICMANVACGRDTGATHEHRAVAPRRCDRRTAGGVAVTGQCVGLFALWGFCDPSPFRSIKGCFRRWSSPNNLPASVGNFGQIGTLPHHQAVDPRSSRAPGPDFGAHGTVVLHLECDAKTAQFRGQIASGRRASAPAYRAIIGVMIAPPAPHGSTTHLSVTNWLLPIHTARGYERENCDSDKCERLHEHFPRRENYLGQFLTVSESLARSSP
jgi:hypothetical protein